jgi:putative spermidine/putrescine transport system ATP-binding protein
VPLLPGSPDSGPVVVLVRPEHITLAADPAGAATVVSASFLGANGRVVIDPGPGQRSVDGDPVLVQVPSSAVRGYAPGMRVSARPTADAALAVSAR